jgi:type III secretory pathway component EscT
VGLVPTFFFAASNLLFLTSGGCGALLGILSTNYNILAFGQQIIARYGRQMLSKADIMAQYRIPLATRF